tara:strand:- start:365 stop:946 length:582 start_codon:yes stop_codon:yes gene_type:complete
MIPELMGGRSLSHPLPLAVGKSSSKMYVGGQANADVAAGTTTATSDAENECAEYSIPANTLVAGSTIRVRWVTATSASAGVETLITRLRFGSSTTASSNTEVAVSTAVDQTNGDFSCGDMIIQVRTSVTAVAFGTIADSDGLGSKLVSAQFEPSFTIDATVANYINVTTLFSSTGANLATTQGFVVDIVNPGV